MAAAHGRRALPGRAEPLPLAPRGGDMAIGWTVGGKGTRSAVFRAYRQADYQVQNFPGSKQTQVTGLNNKGVTVGFWSSQNKANMANNNFGFYAVNGTDFHSVNFPTSDNSTPPVNQLLGVNDNDIAVGFYADGQGNTHGYEYNIASNSFSDVSVAGATSVVAAGINNLGNVAASTPTAAARPTGSCSATTAS